jgi:polar amino acid transport system substrate-binding protein
MHPGDRVACAGAGYANHAEVVSIPKNLVALVPEGVSLEEACGTTLCAIALQGLRVADLRIGEVAGVIGLGLLGQITIQLLKASGCTAIGIDLDPAMVGKAREVGADRAILRSDPVEEIVFSLTSGHGLDATILCAATGSNDPVELAGILTRKRGRVIAVGTLPMDIPRRIYYPKELELRLSTSYGPGRYDPEYEERGHDYPYAYVRFTERRNMETALALMAAGKVRLSPVVTHRFPIDRAAEAYSLVESESTERPLGILFDYGIEKERQTPTSSAKKSPADAAAQKETIRVGIIGAGQFAGGVLLPRIASLDGVEMRRVVTARGANAQSVAKRYRIPHASCRAEDAFEDSDIDAVVIATRNHLHAEQVIAAVEAGKDVFVEKPLALGREELDAVKEAVERTGRTVMVGFNRRFALLARKARQWFEPRDWPLTLSARVNAGRIDRGSWLLGPKEGGGRIIGEVCHFIDLLAYWTGAEVVRVQAECVRSLSGIPSGEENVVVSLGFSDGSVASLVYSSESASGLPKERYEIGGGGKSAVLDDFRRLELYDRNKKSTVRSRAQDKGHSEELDHFFRCVREGRQPDLTFESCVRTTEATFAICEVLRGESPPV